MKKTGKLILFAILLMAALEAADPVDSSANRTPLSSGGAIRGSVRVALVGNAGFLIQIGDRKILIDPLPEEGKEALAEARSPYNDVNLILITHNHADHFDVAAVRQHLQNNPSARLVSTAQVAGQFGEYGDRVVALTAAKGYPALTEAGGIQIKAIYLSHGSPGSPKEIINFGYLVTADGFRMFHTGDAALSLVDMTGPLSPEKRIDLAFIGHFYLDNDPREQQFVKEWINSRFVIANHSKFTNPGLTPERIGQIKSLYPSLVILEKEMEIWDMPK
jgi:L-ascorbate metabolism protein UlaG (beta-lactamase superfamily)